MVGGGPESPTPWGRRARWGGRGGLRAGGWVRARGGRGCSELSRIASPCGRPGGGAAGGGQSRPGPRSAVGPAPRSAGTNPAEHHPRGRILVEAGGSATPSIRGRTGPGRAPPEGYRGGGRGSAPGLRGPGPWWLWAGAGETERASGRRRVRGGVEGPGGLGGEPREAPGGWARAPEGDRSLRGGGGLLPARAARGAAWCGAGAQPCGAAQGRSSVGPRRGAACSRAWVQRGAAEERGVGPRMGAAWGRAGARRGAAQGCSVGLRRGAAQGRAWARHEAAQGRSSVGPRRGAAWGCAAAHRGAEQGRSVGLRRGAVVWGCTGAQRGAAHGRGMGLRRGAVAWGCAGAQRGAAQGRSAGVSRGESWGCAGAQ